MAEVRWKGLGMAAELVEEREVYVVAWLEGYCTSNRGSLYICPNDGIFIGSVKFGAQDLNYDSAPTRPANKCWISQTTHNVKNMNKLKLHKLRNL